MSLYKIQIPDNSNWNIYITRGQFTTVIVIFLLSFCPLSWSQVVFVDVPQIPSPEEWQLECGCQFYGLDIVKLDLSDKVKSFTIANALKQGEKQALIIAGDALDYIDAHEVLSTLQEKYGKEVSVLLLGLTSKIDPAILNKWSKGAIIGCGNTAVVGQKALYEVSNTRQIARQLTGLEFSVSDKNVHHLILDESHEVQAIIHFRNGNQEDELAIFVKISVGDKEVFFLARLWSSTLSEESSLRFDRDRFFEIAPILMFLRYTFGERCWHSARHYANLTIDDPWLIEPYGWLSYKGLLKEMQKADFHTTIAFIPWNYDRSDIDIASLFREHQDRFSICIHGNNHDHYEFYKYKTDPDDPWPAKSLSAQQADIEQALARMEEFKKLTGLPFEPVFVFPHGIAPAKTLGLLKKYNFLTTVNSDNIPLDSKKPQNAIFHLRTTTLDFENFPSLKRNSVERFSPAETAINLFLDNPILLYGHHDIFQNGISSFNEVAEVVNNIEPNVRWQSLGYIVRHQYLQKIRADGNYDVRAFCKTFELENTQKRNLTYYIQKAESFSPPIKQVTVNGRLYPYERSVGDLCLTIDIPAGQSRLIDIEYKNDLDLAGVDISKNDARVRRMRRLSDFRDITLSRGILGRAFINVYYRTGLYKRGLKQLLIISFALAVAICLGGSYCLARCIRRHRMKKAGVNARTEGDT